ncbi:hypothetical protein DMENIID0001_056360 [Sergentomyia squamirostris]
MHSLVVFMLLAFSFKVHSGTIPEVVLEVIKETSGGLKTFMEGFKIDITLDRGSDDILETFSVIVEPQVNIPGTASPKFIRGLFAGLSPAKGG